MDQKDWQAFGKVMLKKDAAGLKQLIESGFDLNRCSPDGRTSPMSKAISWSKGVELMLKLGADPDFQDEMFGSTALMEAAKGGGHVKSAELLIAAGADVNIQSKKGFTALWWACLNDGKKPEQIAMMLMDAGADVNACPGGSILTAAAGGSTAAVIQRIIDKGGQVNAINTVSTVLCPLHAAIEKNRKPAVEILLKAGADPGVKLTERVSEHAPMTLLELAEFRGYNQIAQRLKDAG